jgi:hypothetical protein
MTIEVDEKRFLTLRNALWAIGIVVVVGLVAGAILLNHSNSAISALSSEIDGLKTEVKSLIVLRPVDTPVVLIGGSLKLMPTKTWTPLPPGSGNGYSTAGTAPIATIVIMNNSDGAGTDPTTDRLRVSIPDNTTWSVDLFTQKPFPNKAKVTIRPETDMSVIDMVLDNPQVGILCPDPTTNPPAPTMVYYNDSGKCPNPPASDGQTSFTSMTVTVGANVVGTLNCFDAVVTPGSVGPNHCKVVFRTKPSTVPPQP